MATRTVNVRQILYAALFLLASYAAAMVVHRIAPEFGVVLFVAPALCGAIAATKGPRPVLQAMIAVLFAFAVLRLELFFEPASSVPGLAAWFLITLCIAIPVAFGVAKARRRDEPEGEDAT